MKTIDRESEEESDADTESVIVDKSTDSVVLNAVRPCARLRTRSSLETF